MRKVTRPRTAARWLDLFAEGVGRCGYRCVRLYRVGRLEGAVEQVDLLLKHRMFPSTW